MKASPKKFRFFILSKNRFCEYNLLIDSNVIKGIAEVESWRLIIGNKLNFEKHTAKLCHTASCKLHELKQKRKKLTLGKATVTMINSQFNYAPLSWMLYECQVWHYEKANSDHIRQAIANFPWDRAFANLNVNEMVCVFNKMV